MILYGTECELYGQFSQIDIMYLLIAQIREFVNAIENEGGKAVYGRSVKAPKVLADIVESVAAAVYIDVDFDLVNLWKVSYVLLIVFFRKWNLDIFVCI